MSCEAFAQPDKEGEGFRFGCVGGAQFNGGWDSFLQWWREFQGIPLSSEARELGDELNRRKEGKELEDFLTADRRPPVFGWEFISPDVPPPTPIRSPMNDFQAPPGDGLVATIPGGPSVIIGPMPSGDPLAAPQDKVQAVSPTFTPDQPKATTSPKGPCVPCLLFWVVVAGVGWWIWKKGGR
jgi:hypothetical protein